MARITGPCPGCNRVVQAPAAGTSSSPGSSTAAGQTSAGRASSHRTLRLSASAEDTAPSLPELAAHPDYPFLAPPQGADELGRLGPYGILKVLGTGAMGVVFLAEDPHLKRLVALKVMRPSLAASAEFHRRFLREARLAAAIEHEHIVPIYQAGEDRGVPFLAMKLLRGETLEDRLRRTGGRLPLPEVLRIGREVAEGLAAAHAQGLIHRDVKPANVGLEAGRDRVKIVGFGLARGTGSDAHFTQAGAVIGTPAYMAPEQANAEDVDARCDLFSLGAVLYRAGTGTLPFGGKDTLSVLSALATQTPAPPHRLVPSLPRAFSGLVMRLLAKDPADRPQSAQEVVEAIEAIERGESPEEGTAPPDEAPAMRGRKRDQAASPPATTEEDQERAAAEVKRKGPKKARPSGSRRKKRPEAERDWGRLVLVVSLVLLGVALLVLLFAAIRHVSRARAAASEDPTTTWARASLSSSRGTTSTTRSLPPCRSATPPC
ncbi:MAG: serine/threonine protein kinase [Planctomycetes bacterium]|nr:serine/threonine protein kinase [Planctomycetota bacterium]